MGTSLTRSNKIDNTEFNCTEMWNVLLESVKGSFSFPTDYGDKPSLTSKLLQRRCPGWKQE